MRPLFGVTRPHLGATRPRVGIAMLGLEAPTWQCFIINYCCPVKLQRT